MSLISQQIESILLIVDRRPTPAIMPIVRSQQGGILVPLRDPDLDLSLTRMRCKRTRRPILKGCVRYFETMDKKSAGEQR